MRFALIAVLCLPLAGCFGATLPSGPVPDWAMNAQAEPQAPIRRQVVRRIPADARSPDRTANASFALATGTGHAQDVAAHDDVKPFSAEWQAREDALDTRLRRTMSICRGC